MLSTSSKKVSAFRSAVLKHWKEHGRHGLPWRKTTNPYRILVSEIMLQQTQVPRVIEKYKPFLKKFPTVYTLAKAPLKNVLKEWSGLGYNRRAKYLHETAKILAKRGTFDLAALDEPLPGVGAYTKAAVKAFAFNEPAVLIETNIRAAYIHHFFEKRKSVKDKELLSVIKDAARGQDPRIWHWALMDYGSNIKRLHTNPNRRSAHYSMQSPFEGSLREVRGAILKLLTEGSFGDLAISKRLEFDGKRVRHALFALANDGLILSEKGSWRIAS